MFFSDAKHVRIIDAIEKKRKKKKIWGAPGGLPGSTPHPPFKNQKFKNRLDAVKSIATRGIQPKLQVSTTTQ